MNLFVIFNIKNHMWSQGIRRSMTNKPRLEEENLTIWDIEKILEDEMMKEYSNSIDTLKEILDYLQKNID